MSANNAATPMELDVRIYPYRGEGPTVATASVTLNNCFAIRDVRIMESKNGLFVSMPSRKVQGEYRDVCFPCTKEFKQQFDRQVLDAAVCTVHIVVDSDKTHALLGEQHFRVKSHLQVVSP